MEPFKNIYNDKFFAEFMQVLSVVIDDFNSDLFMEQVCDKNWQQRELKDRMKHICFILHHHLSSDFPQAVQIILKIVNLLKTAENDLRLEYMFLPDYIETYGLDDYKISMQALEQITKFTSCEFAIRPFIIKDSQKTMQQMLLWSQNNNESVRRLASEGCRPRLPWACSLPEFKKNPMLILPILENLKADKSLFVRKSIANNLNDIAKDNPDIVINIIKKWQGINSDTNWLIKHAARTLLKKGDKEVMKIFGLEPSHKIKIDNFLIVNSKIKIGNYLEFSFNLYNQKSQKTKIRLEYVIYYQKANGTLTKKVYKISEKDYSKNSITKIIRRQSFKVISTRKFHQGLHKIAVIINGREYQKYDFILLTADERDSKKLRHCEADKKMM